MTELWLIHFSVESWVSPKLWCDYFEGAQDILGTKVKFLDTNDPVRKRVTSVTDAAQFVADHGSEQLFGKCQARGVGFSVQYFGPSEQSANSFKWYFEAPTTDKNILDLQHLFDLGNKLLSTFYSLADSRIQIAQKKKPSGAVNLEMELIGVFWLTYFNGSYVNYFGADKVAQLPGIRWDSNGGGTTILGEHPTKVDPSVRRKLEEMLGSSSFVDPTDSRGKLVGQSALTFGQLRSPSPASE